MQSPASSTRLQARASSAPVLEFVCLFTHDLRRKQKRWQDGRLKYHTFNKRVMVYDERGNSVGDAHWREDYDFGDGEELELERGSAIVQVAECTGSRDQDLSELIDKRAQEKAQRQSAVAARRPAVEPPTPQSAAPHAHLRHRPLHNVIGTPTGHHGRALVPTESPYEERQKQASSPRDEGSRPTKRRKRDISPPSKSGYARSLFGATLSLSGFSMSQMSQAPIRSQPYKSTRDREENSPPASSDPSNQGAVRNQAPKVKAVTGTSARTTPLNVMSGNMPLGNTVQHRAKPPVEVINLDEPEVQSSPPLNSAHFASQSLPPNVITRRPDLISGRVVMPSSDQRPLTSLSVNKPLRESKAIDVASSKSGSKRQMLDEGVSTKVSRRKRDEQPQPDKHEATDQRRNRSEKPRRSDTQNTADATEEPKDLPSKEPPTEEPRTELRIKPRKKRGLLMLSEQGAFGASSRVSKTSMSKLGQRSSSTSFEESRPDSSVERRSMTKPSMTAVVSNTKETEQMRLDISRADSGSANLTDSWPLDIPEIDKFLGVTHANHKASKCDDQSKTTLAREKTRAEGDAMADVRLQNAGSAGSAGRLLANKSDALSRLDRDHRTPEPSSDDPFEEMAPRKQIERTVQEQIVNKGCDKQGNIQGKTQKSPKRRKQPSRKKQAPKGGVSTTAPNKIGDKPGSSVSGEYVLPDGVPAPRLAQVGSKSVRSKEVIGFVFDEDMDPPNFQQQAVSSRQPPSLQQQAGSSKQEPAGVTHTGRNTSGKTTSPILSGADDAMATDTMDVRNVAPKILAPPPLAESADAAKKSNQICGSLDTQGAPASESKITPAPPVRKSSTITAKAPAVSRTAEPSTSVAKHQQPQAPLSRNDSTGSDIPNALNAQVDVQAVEARPKAVKQQPQPAPKVVNPASRGKKAAKPSDAAGQVPVCPLPSEPVTNPGLAQMTRKTSRQGDPGKGATAPMPGFARANGGPWSREAHDLFEFTRP
ncbi:Uu.00g109950.m01.CDS01 [Anthostomella pinea]|uniref:Uu.00g109950.m01.CDS01 n=1 Tax=Anthostomella pinea TaxID=933095 RepID=A0AAI8YGC8_9PEZI|nr:Uu.00g109950.m01.CDS01 [Anthostomella pinea]